MAANPPIDLDDDDLEQLSTTPTPGPFSALHRSVSHSSWSASETPLHHHQGTSYFNLPPSSPSVSGHTSPVLSRHTGRSQSRRPGRSTSVGSSQATNRGYRDDDVLSEQDEDGVEEDESSDAEERRHARRKGKAPASPDDDSGEGEISDENDVNVTTLKDRQSMINVQHPFGLPIWKPALYKKSRSVTRHADEALHSVPSAQAERHLLPGNIFWALAFGWWLGIICVLISIILWFVPQGGEHYSSLVYGLGWYLFWPFGKYVEGDAYELDGKEDDEDPHSRRWSGSNATVRGVEASTSAGPSAPQPSTQHAQSVSWSSDIPQETTALLGKSAPKPPPPSRSYGTAVFPVSAASSETLPPYADKPAKGSFIGKGCFWLALVSIIAPLLLIVCLICWALVVTIPMARLNWALIKYLFTRPTTIRFCAAPPVVVVQSEEHLPESTAQSEGETTAQAAHFTFKHARLSAGQAAPFGSPTSTVLLCTYRAVGLQYYKYTVGGVNILFVNLMPVVFFVIFDGFVLLPLVEKMKEHDQHIPAFLDFVVLQGTIFFLSLLSVIPLSYFIGMAVASISAQSSIGMGAVINATFGSIIEIILYSIALTQGKGRLVEGSIVGSLLAGVLLMPGMSMASMALRHKEQKFNAKSASVTSLMLIMAIVGALTPTLFYQIYGNFQLVCTGCPTTPIPGNAPWICDHCYYKHPNPVDDPFYQLTVKKLMYFCAIVLVLSYLIGLWFSLRTHATQIWQNPQQVLHATELPSHANHRVSIHRRTLPQLNTASATGTGQSRPPPLYRKPSHVHTGVAETQGKEPFGISGARLPTQPNVSPLLNRRVSYAQQPAFLPVLESVDHAVQNTDLGPLGLSGPMTTDEFTRAVAVATVSALRHQQTHAQGKVRISAGETDASGGHGGHDAPSWSRTVSASVLLTCTALYAVIAELLVDVVDVVLEGSRIDEKFLGITLFALVPNTTEFMNAMSFALNGNIALSMEIGSAYALQVCLLQIPAMVAFSAWYYPDKIGEAASTFTLIFPRWDVTAIILSMFLMTYTYIEAKSNYHRGSILILSYVVLTAGFFFAPPTSDNVDQGHFALAPSSSSQEFTNLTLWQTARWYLSTLWA